MYTRSVPVLRSPVPARLHDRMCLRCGYRGEELQGGPGSQVFSCPRCAEDLYARPARSYAELEGLGDTSARISEGLPSPWRFNPWAWVRGVCSRLWRKAPARTTDSR